MYCRAVGAALASLCIVSTTTWGTVPRLINYQGRLTDSTGVSVPDGNYSVTFRICEDSVGGNILWEEAGLVTVQGGLFSVILGSIILFPDSLFEEPDRWLEIKVGLDPEMTPRSRLTSMPFALQAAAAERADTAAVSLDKTVDASELVLGTLDPARFSAYGDLVSEARIGIDTGQVAPGDHSHAATGVM